MKPPSPAPLPADVRALLPALHTWIVGLALRRGVRTQDAADVAQDVIVRVLRGLTRDPERPLYSLRGWIIGITARVVSELCAREYAPPRVHPQRAAERLATADLAASIEARSSLRALESSTSPARWRALLASAESMTGDEIAAAEGAPRGTIYTRIRAGRRDLAAALARESARARGARSKP